MSTTTTAKATARALDALKAVLRAEMRCSVDSFAVMGSRGHVHLLLSDWHSGDPDGFRRGRRAVRALAVVEGKNERQLWRELLGAEDDEE